MSKTGGVYRVLIGDTVVAASLRGRCKQQHAKRILVGDRVEVSIHADGSCTVEGIQERKTVLCRRSPGKAGTVRDVAANVDQVVVVGAARDPIWNPHLIDRFLAVGEANDLDTVLVVNKCDLVCDIAELITPYRRAGYLVIRTSVVRGDGLRALRELLDGRISLLSGPTGVGKSSLLNALQPGLELPTGAVSSRTGTGRHTTVAAEMHRFGVLGMVVDTPGLRDIGLWGLSPDEVAAAFPDVGEFAGDCRFDNCRHLEEPGCAVLRAVKENELAKPRHDSYRQLLAEAERAAKPWSH